MQLTFYLVCMQYYPLLFLLALLATCSSQPAPPLSALQVSSGRVERHADFPASRISDRHLDVWLPDTYDGHTPHAVLYMHDGQMLYDSTGTWNHQEWGVDEVLGQLIADGKVRPTIVVGVWNGGVSRHADYFPQRVFEAMPQSFQDSILDVARRTATEPLTFTDVQSDAYLEFLVKAVKPFIDSTYTTLADVSNTFVAGSSMGGLISMYALCEYPDVFSAAACLSTHWPGFQPGEGNPAPPYFHTYLKDKLPPPGQNRIYFDYGTETLDAYYEPHQLVVDSIMHAKGYDDKLWETRKFPGHPHLETAWRERLHIPLTFLLR